jgi:uncharacterized protein YbaP (TraB family)
MKRIIIVLAVFLCLNVNGQDPPVKKYQSLLWEVTGNGLKTPSYLYGTMHVSDKVAFHLNDTFFAAVSNCDMVALEIDADQWLGKNQDIINARNSIEYTSTNYTSNFYKNSFSLDIPSSDDLKDMIQTYPSIISHILYRTYDNQKNFEEDTYLDMFIYQVGKKMNKKTGGLEDFIKSEEMANKAYEYYYSDLYSDKDYEKKKIRIKELSKGYSSLYDLFDDAYRSGDLDLIDTIEKLVYPRKYLEYMLLKRNAVMANSMDSIMKYSSLFAAVGCAHLPGDSGVISLLREKGYTLRPVNYLSTNGIDPKIRSQLEETRIPRTFTIQYPSDSSFSVMLPGLLSEYDSDNDGIKKYLYDDPANGSYYYIIRTNHFAKLYGQSETYVLQRIDSILYESVPGKILKKEICYSNNGYPGYNIENETETGDRQQYRIYITPDEILIFKMSGTGNYVSNGDEAETFFNSITFYRKGKNDFSEFSSNTGGYSINFPENKCYYTSDNPSSERRDLLTSASAGNDEYYFLMCSRLFDFSYIEEDTFELNMLAESFAESIGYTINTRYFLNVNSHPALNTSIIKDGKKAEIRIVISGPFYYLAGCICDDPEKRQEFLNSFKLQDISYSMPFRNYSDTSLQFTTKMPFEENEFMKLVKSENSYYSYSYSQKNKDLLDYMPVDKYRYYLNIETGEVIGLSYNKFSAFYRAKSINTFWKEEVNDLTLKNKYIIKYIDSTASGNISRRVLLLTDTNSTRGILVKMLLKGSVLYTLLANIDTLSGPSFFVKTFFDNFVPADTIIGTDLCSSKNFDFWFDQLHSTDTTIRKRAIYSISSALPEMEDENVTQLIKLIQDTTFSHFTLSVKSSIIKELGSLKSKEILPFLKELYLSYADSVSIQFAILDAVVMQKNEQAMKCILDLLNKNMIVSSSTYAVPYLFESINDSLKLARSLFPDILKFTKYEEYRKPVYKLLSDLLEKGFISKKSYASYKNEILRDAQYDLNKLISAKEIQSSYYNYDYYSYYNYSNYYTPDPTDNIKETEKVFYYYSVILRPFYSDEVKNTVLNKIITSGSDELAVAVFSHYLKFGLKINDTLYRHYAEDPETVSTLYSYLTYNKITNLTDDTCFSQERLILSELFKDKYDLKKDSVVLVEKKNIRSKEGSGYIYIFKTCKHGQDIWSLGYSGIHAKENNKTIYDTDISSTSFKFETEKQMEDEISKIMKKVRCLGHDRADADEYYSYYDYY